MLFRRIAVDTTKLSTGMYVAMLDRPWLETPFVFQGFEIKDRIEIEQLQSYCRYVYVDIDRGKLSEANIRSIIKSGTTASISTTPSIDRARHDRGWFSRCRARVLRMKFGSFLLTPLNKDKSGYDISSTVRREAAQANEAYELLLERHRLILERADRHGAVNIDAIEKAVMPTVESVLRNPNAMAWTIFSRKRSGHHYSRAVATSVWAIMFGRHLGFDRQALQDLAVGGLLLDIGNVALSADILNLEGSITIEQYEHMSRHVHLGLEILQASQGVRTNVLDMVRCHHERADGSGYPDKLTGNTIPVYGRIAGIVDCYDAMTTKTSYSPAMAAYDSARELNEMSGKQFQSEVVEQFLRTIGMFPTGSVVELSDGTVGVVLEQNPIHPLRPKVMLLLNKKHRSFGQPKILDMQKLPAEASGSRAIWIAKGHEHGAFGIDPMDYFKREMVPDR